MDDTDQSAALQQLIRETFPAQPYHGVITLSDGGPWTPDPGEGEDLYEALNGRSWTEVPREFVHQNPDGYVLLTPQALRAFLAAWFTCALEDMDKYNEVRDFLFICFEANGASRYFSPLDNQQRFTLCALMEYFSQVERSENDRAIAASALEHIRELMSAGQCDDTHLSVPLP